jgi:hypothetical protein
MQRQRDDILVKLLLDEIEQAEHSQARALRHPHISCENLPGFYLITGPSILHGTYCGIAQRSSPY